MSAATATASATHAPASGRGAVMVTRLAIVAMTLAAWEALARSGLLFQDVVPSLLAIAAALARLLGDPETWLHMGWTGLEVLTALAIGGSAGALVGFVLGASRFLGRAFEPYLYYLGPTPKIIFFPVMIMWFGVGPASKIALATLSCFFPVALATAAAMREVDRVLIRVGRSFRASPRQMLTKIYLPAMRFSIVNGVRIGLGVAIIATLLAETKLSNKGIGHLIARAYSTFAMPMMYALLITVFVLAIAANAAVGRLGGLASTRPH